MQGLAPKMAEVSGVNAVARNNGGNVLAVALDFGVIALYRFPCPYVGTKHKRYAGHSAGVSKVACLAVLPLPILPLPTVTYYV